MFRSLRNSRFSDADQGGIVGSVVYDANDERVGTIEDLIVDEDRSVPGYAVVKSGGLVRSERYLIPADQLWDREGGNGFRAPIAKDDVDSLPPYDDRLLESEDRFRNYESRYTSMWPVPEARREKNVSQRMRSLTEAMSGHSERKVRPISEGSAPVSSGSRTSDLSSRTSGQAVVYGVFQEQEHVERAVEALNAQGFQKDDISVVFPDKGRTKRFAVEKETKAPEGAAAGGGTGMVVGGVLGWLAAAGTIAIPGIGPLLAAGPIVAALAGAGAVGAAGGLVGALVGLGVPEYEARRYETEVKSGRILLSVRCPDQRLAPSARSILEKNQAKDVFATGESRAA